MAVSSFQRIGIKSKRGTDCVQILFLHKTDTEQYMVFISTSIQLQFCLILTCNMSNKRHKGPNIHIDVSAECTIDRPVLLVLQALSLGRSFFKVRLLYANGPNGGDVHQLGDVGGHIHYLCPWIRLQQRCSRRCTPSAPRQLTLTKQSRSLGAKN